VIEFKDVSKHFGQTQVLHNIDLKINQGEVVVIIGHPVPVNQPCCAVLTSWKRSPVAN